MFTLIILSIAIALASIGGGILPLKLPALSSHISAISVFSVGMLISTAVSIVIPEGIESLYQTSPDPPSIAIGFPLLLGFVAMFLVDSLTLFLPGLDPKSDGSVFSLLKSVIHTPLTLALVLHAGIDGVSLGSSFAKADPSLGIIYAVLIIVHKLPAAFSLSSLLLDLGLPTKIVLFHLGLFAVITPCSSISTFLAVTSLDVNDQQVVAVLLLFSAGTLLFVATHFMSNEGYENPETSGPSPASKTMLSLLGMVIPLALSLLKE